MKNKRKENDFLKNFVNIIKLIPVIFRKLYIDKKVYAGYNLNNYKNMSFSFVKSRFSYNLNIRLGVSTGNRKP